MAECVLAGCAKPPPPRPAPAPVATPAPEPDILQPHVLVDHARAVVDALNGGHCDQLEERLTERMKKAVPAPKFAAACDELVARTGRVTSWRILQLASNEGRFELDAEKDRIILKLNRRAGDERLSGVLMRPPPPPDPPVAVAALEVLPVASTELGRWTVLNGGPTARGNNHIGNDQQRRAVDLVVVDDTGTRHRGDGSANADYFAYGQPVLAAAAGTVRTVVRGVPDNVPGVMNGYLVPGNVVVIEHAPETFAVYAHFAPGSIEVEVGDEVKAGQRLGKVGNSGRSTEPHLHFHVQSKVRLSAGWGLDPHFAAVEQWRDGKWSTVTDYAFDHGHVIRPVSPPPPPE